MGSRSGRFARVQGRQSSWARYQCTQMDTEIIPATNRLSQTVGGSNLGCRGQGLANA